MGREIVYCNTCGNQILESEFQKGKAITILRKNYCKNCMKAAVQKSQSEQGATEKSKEGKTHRTPAASSERRASETRRIPRATPGPPSDSRRNLLPIGGAFIAIAFLILLVFLLKGR